MMTAGPTSLADTVFAALTDRAVMLEHFPMLLAEGIPDTGLAVHSHFLTLLVGVGQAMHYAAVAECPIWWAADDGIGDVRADSVWFEKAALRPRLAVEFERFERGDEGKLRGKVENLGDSVQHHAGPSTVRADLLGAKRFGCAKHGRHRCLLSRRV